MKNKWKNQADHDLTFFIELKTRATKANQNNKSTKAHKMFRNVMNIDIRCE